MKQKTHYKIGILIDQLTIGGVQKIAIEDARALTKLGHFAQVLVLMRKGYKPQYKSFKKGVRIRFLSDSYPWPLKYSIKFPIFSFFSTLHILSPFLSRLAIKEKEFDIIISHGTTTCFTAQTLKKTRDIPYLAAIHDPMNYILKIAYSDSLLKILFPLLSPILRVLEKNLIADCEKVLLLSKLHQGFITKTYHIQPIILPAAARIPKFIPNKSKNHILAMTRWENKKNPRLLIEIAKAIPNAKIIMAGNWTNRSELEEFRMEITRQGLAKVIQLCPYVSENRLQVLYQSARVFIHPIKEAFGMGGLEAAANACPVVIPAGSGIATYLRNHEDGIFINKQTTQKFITAIKYLWSNPRIADKMGKSAQRKIQKLNWENHAKKLIEIITTSLNPKEKIIVALETGHSSESYLAGGDRLLEKMATYFPNNYKLKIILPEIGTNHWLDSKLKNVELTVLTQTMFDNRPNPTWVFLAYLVRIWQTYWQLRKIKKIDMIYSSTNVLPDIAPAYLFKLTHPQIPWIVRIHHQIASPIKRPGRLTVNLVSYLMQAVSNFMIRNKSTLTLALNNRLVKTLTYLKFPKNKLMVLGAGIDFRKINNAKSFKRKSFDGIFVGRIHPSKGIYDLIKIWKIVTNQKPDAKAIIVGEGAQEERSKLLSQIKKAKLENNLKLAGYLSENQLYSTLKSTKIFLFTDHEAGWGLAIGEAMAAGLPVVGYNLDIFGDVYKQGFVPVPITDTQKFANQILNLLNDHKSYTQLSKLALKQAKQLSWQQTSRQFQKIAKNFV